MNHSQFFSDVKAGNILPVYLFTGSEALVKESALRLLGEKLLPAGLEALNETVMESPSAQSIIEACETLPMMCDRRLVVAREIASLMPAKPNTLDDEAERLIKWLPGAPPSCCLVFFMRDVFDGRRKLSGYLVKMGAQVCFDPLDDIELNKWIKARARARGVNIDPAVANHLVFLAGRSLTRLKGEIDKLCAYAGEGGQVKLDMVEELVPPSLEASVFRMIDSLMDGRAERAFTILRSMLYSGERRLGILYMLTRQMRLLTHISLLKGQGLPMPEIVKRLSLSPKASRLMENQAARFATERLLAGYRACVRAEYRVKSGQAREEAALDELLFTLGPQKTS